MNPQRVIYGGHGYTGELMVREAVRRGLRPAIAGRSASKPMPLANELGLEYRAFDVGQGVTFGRCEEQVHLVAHEDVGVYGDTMLIHDIAQKIMKVVPIDVVNEDRAAIYPALGDMKQGARKLEARVTRHATILGGDKGTAIRGRRGLIDP